MGGIRAPLVGAERSLRRFIFPYHPTPSTHDRFNRVIRAARCRQGTQAEIIVEMTGKPQISTGDMLRSAVSLGTELGLEAKGYMEAGKLVPDEVIIGLIEDRLGLSDASNGVLFDGFPRTIPQAEALSEITEVSAVISIEVPDEEIVNRIVGRRMDPETGEIYHVSFKPPPPELASRLVQRKDDNENTVRMRLAAYHEQTKPLGDWYGNLGILSTVDGTGTIQEVSQSVAKCSKKLMR